jgi:hypothetical protein
LVSPRVLAGKLTDKSAIRGGGELADILLEAVGALALFAGLSVYCALRLAKKTDEMVSIMENEEEGDKPLTVYFPKSVFVQNPRRQVITHID